MEQAVQMAGKSKVIMSGGSKVSDEAFPGERARGNGRRRRGTRGRTQRLAAPGPREPARRLEDDVIFEDATVDAALQ